MSILSVTLLGSPAVMVDNELVLIDRRKAMALLSYLAVTRSRQQRESLATLLWPTYEQVRAQANLRNALWALKQAIGADWLEIDRETICLQPGFLLDFTLFLEQTTAAREESDPTTQLALLDKAIQLYQGPFLAGFTLRDAPDFDEWQFFQAQRIAQEVESTLQRLTESYQQQEKWSLALEYGRRWLALNEFDETIHYKLMQLYACAGQKTAALRQFEICVHMLVENFDMQPRAETVDLYERIRKGVWPLPKLSDRDNHQVLSKMGMATQLAPALTSQNGSDTSSNDLKLPPPNLMLKYDQSSLEAIYPQTVQNGSSEQTILPFIKLAPVNAPFTPHKSADTLSSLERDAQEATKSPTKQRPEALINDDLVDTLESRHRVQILRKVENFWIKGVWESVLQNTKTIDLSVQYVPQQVQRTWDMIIQRPHNAPAIPSNAKVFELFENETDGTLLILGKPGSGKTITLLELTRYLITRAKRHVNEPIPIVLNLSSWHVTHAKLTDWIVAELSTHYQTPKTISKKWLEDEKLLLLLDGLDEVQRPYQGACIEAINDFRLLYGLIDVVVCSRMSDYEQTEAQLNFSQAIMLKPLTYKQVCTYLSDNRHLQHVAHQWQNNPTLREIMESPLMLSILAQVGQETEISWFDKRNVRSTLFDAYVKQMFRRRSGLKPYSINQTKAWLIWLAQKMAEHFQTIHLIEHIQPSWLSTKKQKWSYILISYFIVGGIISGGLWLSDGLSDGRIVSILTGTCGCLIGSVNGLTFGLSSSMVILMTDALVTWVVRRAKIKPLLQTLLTFGFVTICGLGVGFVWLEITQRFVRPGAGLTTVVLGMIYSWLIWVTLFAKRGRILTNEIQTVEALSWSWSDMGRGAIVGLSIGLIVGFIFVSLIARTHGFVEIFIARRVWWSGILLAWGLGTTLTGALVGGLRGGALQTKTFPNQGVYHSIKNALIAGLSFGVGFALCFWVANELVGGQVSALINVGVPLSYLVGIIVALKYGGLDVIKHYTLRFVFWCTQTMPMNYSHFLDYAVDRTLLQRVGGGYIFIHRMLLEYFSSLPHQE